MVPTVTTLLGWLNYGPYGTHRHNSTGLAELWSGWPIELEFACYPIMFGYGVNQCLTCYYSQLVVWLCGEQGPSCSVLGKTGNYSVRSAKGGRARQFGESCTTLLGWLNYRAHQHYWFTFYAGIVTFSPLSDWGPRYLQAQLYCAGQTMGGMVP